MRNVRGVRHLTFQSSPGTLAGCDLRVRCPLALEHDVSILTRHAGRVRHEDMMDPVLAKLVSILTRHAGRVRRCTNTAAVRPAISFQSSPGTLAGCDRLPQLSSYLHFRVSILTRHAGRVRHARGTPTAPPTLFQSSPGTLAGCDGIFAVIRSLNLE